MRCLPTGPPIPVRVFSTIIGFLVVPRSHVRQIASHTVPSAPVSPTKKENDIELDLTAELERDLLSVVEDAPPRRPSAKREPSSLKSSTSSTPNGASGSQSLPKKPMLKREPKPKPKEPVPIFMNPNSAAARVANKKSAPPKQEPKPEKKPPAPSMPTPVSKVAKLAGDLKRKGVKREAEPGVEGSTRVPKRSRPSPPPQKSRPQPKPQTSKPPALAAGLPPKPQVAVVPPPRPPPQPKPQPPAKKGFSLELPTGTSTPSSSTNPLTSLGVGGGGTSLSLPTVSPALGNTQPPPSTFAETIPVLSDSESDWDEVDAGGPSPPQPQLQTEPQPYRLGSLTIEEDPPAGFNGTLDIVDGDEDRYDDDADADGEGDGEGVDIDMDDLMAEMDEQLQSEGGGGPEGEENVNEIEDFLAEVVSPEPEQDQEGYQDGGVDTFVGGDMFGDEDYSSSSDDSDD